MLVIPHGLANKLKRVAKRNPAVMKKRGRTRKK